LGLLEMTRQRAQESIRSSTFMDCPYCNGKGKVKSALSMSVELQRHLAQVLRSRRVSETALPLKIAVNPMVMERLRKQDEAALITLESKHKGHLLFVSNANLHMEDFVITNAESGEELFSTVEH
jgi:ribonuclease G